MRASTADRRYPAPPGCPAGVLLSSRIDSVTANQGENLILGAQLIGSSQVREAMLSRSGHAGRHPPPDDAIEPAPWIPATPARLRAVPMRPGEERPPGSVAALPLSKKDHGAAPETA